jgi:hypothetical protein
MPTDTDAYSTILYIRSLALLERASKLMYLPVERDSPVYDHLTPSSIASDMSGPGSNATFEAQRHDMPEVASVSPSSDIDDYLSYQNYAADNMTMRQMGASTTKSSTRCARLRTPKAYEKVRAALLRLEADLPPDHRVRWDRWDGHVAAWLYNNPTKEWVTVVSASCVGFHVADIRRSCAGVRGCSCSTCTRIRPRTRRRWRWHDALPTPSRPCSRRCVLLGDS